MRYYYKREYSEYREVTLEELKELWLSNECSVCNLVDITEDAMYFAEEDWLM